MSLGKDDAPVTVIEYASMTCGHCATFHNTTYPEFKKRYIDTGKVRYILREFPLDPLAAGAFMLARCAGKDKYFPLVETLFQQQRTWAVQKPLEPLFAIVRQAGFTQQTFDACLRDQKMLDGIEKVRARASDKFKVEFDADLLHQRQGLQGRAIDRRPGEGDRPAHQDLRRARISAPLKPAVAPWNAIQPRRAQRAGINRISAMRPG